MRWPLKIFGFLGENKQYISKIQVNNFRVFNDFVSIEFNEGLNKSIGSGLEIQQK